MNKAPVNVFNLPVIRGIMKKAHSTILPGLNGASLFDVVKFFIRELRTVRVTERAAAVTYNFLMAMPPTFLFLFSLVPYLPLRNVEQSVLSIIQLLTPNHRIYTNVRKVAVDFMTRQHHDVLSLGILMVLFFSSNGMMGLMRSFDKSLSLYKRRSGLQRRWTAIKLTVMLIGVLIVMLAVLAIQTHSINAHLLRLFRHFVVVKILSFVILSVVVFVAISIIYTYGPSLHHRFRFVSAGSVFATVASIIATSVFFFLVNHFLNYSKVYGSIGSLIAFMVWVWLNTVIILLGYELNVSILLGKLSMEEVDE